MTIDDETCDITDMAAELLAVGASQGRAPGPQDTVTLGTLEADPEVRFALHGEPLEATAALDLIARGIAVALVAYLDNEADRAEG